MRKPAASLLLFTLLAGLFLMRESRMAPGSAVDDAFTDWLAANSAAPATPGDVALATIDDDALGIRSGAAQPWPWPPLNYALFLQASAQFGCPAVAIAPVLSWDAVANEPEAKRNEHAQFLRLLHSAVLRTPRLLLAAELGFSDDPAAESPKILPSIRRVSGDRARIPEFTSFEREPDEAVRFSPTLGFTNLAEEKPVRRIPLLFRFKGETVPSFVLQAAMLWLQLTPDDIEVAVGSHIRLGPRLVIPVDETGAMRVDFRRTVDRISFDDMLLLVQEADRKPDAAAQAKVLGGSFVILGRTDSEEPRHRIGDGRDFTRAEILAAGLATILSSRFIEQAPWWADACIVAAALLIACLLPSWKPGGILFFCALVLASYTHIALVLFAGSMIAMPFLLPAGLLLFSAAFAIFTRSPKPGTTPSPAATPPSVAP